MGKTPKKAAPEGDERNRYVRRLKTASASSKNDEISVKLPAARSVQPEYENTNRFVEIQAIKSTQPVTTVSSLFLFIRTLYFQ